MNPITLTPPLEDGLLQSLRVGQAVRIFGALYTARDAAHKRLCELAAQGAPMPFPFAGQIVYYAGPCPCPPGRVIGPIGPTTSSRMDPYAPALMALGLKVMLGKGARNAAVKAAIQARGGVYLAAVGGAGALLARRVEAAQTVAFPDLGPEAVLRLTVADFPAIVAIDVLGNDLYQRT